MVVVWDGHVLSIGSTHLPGLGALMGTSDCAGHSTTILTASASRHPDVSILHAIFFLEKKISEFFLEVRMEPLSPEGGGGADEEGTGTAHADEVGPPTLRRQL